MNTGFLRLHRDVYSSQKFGEMTGNELKALLHIYEQYRGSNNGSLTCTLAETRRSNIRGLKSSRALVAAIKGVIAKGFVTITRRGGSNKPTLFAVTWEKIDTCKKGRYDDGVYKTDAPGSGWYIEPPRRSRTAPRANPGETIGLTGTDNDNIDHWFAEDKKKDERGSVSLDR